MRCYGGQFHINSREKKLKSAQPVPRKENKLRNQLYSWFIMYVLKMWQNHANVHVPINVKDMYCFINDKNTGVFWVFFLHPFDLFVLTNSRSKHIVGGKCFWETWHSMCGGWHLTAHIGHQQQHRRISKIRIIHSERVEYSRGKHWLESVTQLYISRLAGFPSHRLQLESLFSKRCLFGNPLWSVLA